MEKSHPINEAKPMLLFHGNFSFNPSTLNNWLKSNKGYVNKDDFVWASINPLGVVF